ncbi:superoxide dismutase, Ni [soil metagenome]
MTRFLQLVTKLLPLEIAYAHCDVPCGIYDPKGAQTAALTVLKMVEKMDEMDAPECHDKMGKMQYQNSMTRFVWTKEEHARKCKEELLILWSDYFKPEHLEKFPDLHDKFWKAAKLCSTNKQEASLVHAHELIKAVDDIAEMFVKSKAAK